MATIFISYSSKDRKVAETICNALETRGYPCWIASRNVKPGQNFQEDVVGAIRAARVMVLVFTANANNSDEIKKEVVLAGRYNVVVVPVRVEDVTPNDAFAYEFATRQWIDLFENWNRAMEGLVGQIASLTTAQAAADSAADRAVAEASAAATAPTPTAAARDDAGAPASSAKSIQPPRAPLPAAAALHERGRILWKQGKRDRAIADYTRAIELDPTYAIVINERGVGYHTLNDFDRAVADQLALQARGGAYLRKGDEERAMADFDRAVEMTSGAAAGPSSPATSS